MDKKAKKALLDFMENIEKDAPIFTPIIIGYTVKWGLKTYEHIFDTFVIKGNTITGSSEGIRW